MTKNITSLWKRNYNVLIEVSFWTVICWLLFHVPEEQFDVQRMLWLNLATIAGLFFVAYIRGITIRDIFAWLFIIGMAGILLFLWKIQGISPEIYGEQYSLVLKLRYICYSLFSGLMLDMFRHKPKHIKIIIKSPLLWAYIVFCTIGMIFTESEMIPLIIPFGALVFTNIEQKRVVELIDCFGIGYYLVFFKMFTSSFVALPKAFESGRYVGAFNNLSTTGVHATIAVLIGLYFMLKWINSKKSRMCLAFLIPLWLYPIVVMIMINSRTAEFGLICALIAIFVFLHGKGEKETRKRLLISTMLICIGIIALFGLAYGLQALIHSSFLDRTELPYGLSHIAALAGDYEDGYFDSQLLNRINAFTSQRLIFFDELLNEVRLIGYVPERMDTHNVYLYYMIRYGLFGGIMVIIWAVLYVISAIKLSKENIILSIMPLIYGVFATATEMGMNGYWMLPLGFYWILFSYPLIMSKCYEKAEGCSNELVESNAVNNY